MRNLRIAHIADTHLGYRSATVPGRDDDFASAWLSACRAIVDSKPDLILHAGDVFHRPNPSWAAVATFLEGAEILDEANCPVLGISGNHDSSRIMTKHNVFTVLSGVVSDIFISYDPTPIIVNFPTFDAKVVLLSHQSLLDRNLQPNLEYVLTQIDDAEYKILVAHGDIYELQEARELGGIVIPDFIFEYPWSYAALGHLHVAQPYGKRGWYAGSTERCGWSDYPASPGWTLATLSPTGLRHEHHPLPHLRFIQLPDFEGENDDEVNIADYTLRTIGYSQLGSNERAVARIKLNGIHPFARRSIQSSLQRMVKLHYPHLVFQVEARSDSWIWSDPVDAPQGKEFQSIEDMFRDFVETRIFDDPSIPAKLLEVGLDSISKVQAVEANRTEV